MNWGILFVVVGLLVGCSGTEPARPAYRGRLFHPTPIRLSADLEARLVRTKRFDPLNNCVQMVTRNSVSSSGVDHIDKFLILSPDACPPAGQIAAREADAVKFDEADLSDAAVLPAKAYDLIKGPAPVGEIKLVRRENNELELTDLCTFSDYEPYCSLEISHNGRFSRVNTDRFPVGRLAAARTATQTIVGRINGLEANVIRNMNELQRNIFRRFSATTERLQNYIATEQRAAALITMQYAQRELGLLEMNINGNNNASISTFASTTRQQLSSLQRELMNSIAGDVLAHTERLEGHVSETLNRDIALLTLALAGNNWVSSQVQFRRISWQIQESQRAVNATTVVTGAVQLLAFWGLLEGYRIQMLSAIRAEIRANTGTVIGMMMASSAWTNGSIWLSQAMVVRQVRALDTSISGQQIGQSVLLLGSIWGSFAALRLRMNMQEQTILDNYQTLLRRYTEEAVEGVKVRLMQQARTMRSILHARQAAPGALPANVSSAFGRLLTTLTSLDQQLVTRQTGPTYLTALELERQLRSVTPILGDSLSDAERDLMMQLLRSVVAAIKAAPEDLRHQMPAAATAVGGDLMMAFAAHVRGGAGRPSLAKALVTKLQLRAMQRGNITRENRTAIEALVASLTAYDRTTIRALTVEIQQGEMQLRVATPAEPLEALRTGLAEIVENPMAATAARLGQLETMAATLSSRTDDFPAPTCEQLLKLAVALRQLAAAKSPAAVLSRALVGAVETVSALPRPGGLSRLSDLSLAIGERMAARNEAQLRTAIQNLHAFMVSIPYAQGILDLEVMERSTLRAPTQNLILILEPSLANVPALFP